MIDVTVKTLDSQNHVFSVEEDTTVKKFKETISPQIGIPADQQRLIFRGRVLQDDKPLKEYNVSNSVLHVVQRPANQNSTANDEPPARPSSQAGNRLGDSGIFFSADDGTGGGGRGNAIFMGAIGLPGVGPDIDGVGDEGGAHPRRSGAQIRLMVGNRMLNRASNLLQRLEDSDAVLAATQAVVASSSSSSSETASGGQDSPDSEISQGLINNNVLMEVDDDQDSIEQMIAQAVNVSSSAAALVAEIRQVHQPGSETARQPPPTAPSIISTSSSDPDDSTAGTGGSSTASITSNSTPGSGHGSNSSTISSGTSTSTATANSRASPSPARRPEQPRLRELSTALQDLLALQDRLNPYLRFIQGAIRQNRLYNEQGEAESTQFVYDTLFSILHLLSHSFHAFSEIMCDFSVSPEDRRLSAPSSILVEQSTVVRATIPVAAVPSAHLLGNAAGAGGMPGGAGANNNSVTLGFPISMGQQRPPQQQQPSNTNSSNPNSNPVTSNASLGSILPGVGMSVSMSGPHPITVPISMNIPGMGPGGVFGPGTQQWRNPNIPVNTAAAAAGTGQAAPQPNATSQQTPLGSNNAGTGVGTGNNQIPPGMLPPGFNLGALLGMAGAGGGMVNILGGGGGGASGIPGNTIPLGNFQFGGGNINPISVSANQQQANTTASSTPPGPGQPQNASNTVPTGTRNSGPNGPAGNETSNNNNNNNNNNSNNSNAAMLQNILSNLNRPQFDPLLACHTHHTSGRSRLNRSRPAEFRRFVNVEDGSGQDAGRDEGETIEILLDLVRHSGLVEMLQPVLRDVVLNYLMRGRDPRNETHIRTCAKGLVKKILPYFERFSTKIDGSNDNVDIIATYSNILTVFITSLMQKVLGQTPAGDGQFKSEFLASLTELQRHLIQALKVCYPSCTNPSLLLVNYFVETCLGGMSITFKGHVRDKLVEHLKNVEKTVDSTKSLVVAKEKPAESTVAATTTSVPSTSSASSVSPSAPISSRCAASFGQTPSTSSSGADISMTPDRKVVTNTAVDDDLDDEVLEMPVSTGGGIGAGNRVDASCEQGREVNSIASLLRNLPSEWTDTVEQDVRRQMEMPSQPSFSPGYNTLFPRKH